MSDSVPQSNGVVMKVLERQKTKKFVTIEILFQWMKNIHDLKHKPHLNLRQAD